MDVDGLEVSINGKPYVVAGVVQMNSDRFTRLTLEEAPMAFVYADEFPDQTITNYELVCAEPLTGFTQGKLNELFPLNGGVTVDNTRRYQLSKIDDLIFHMATRNIAADGVAYPYWENAARIVEAHLALLLAVLSVLIVLPAGSVLVWISRKIIAIRRKIKQKRRENDPIYEFRDDDF